MSFAPECVVLLGLTVLDVLGNARPVVACVADVFLHVKSVLDGHVLQTLVADHICFTVM